MKFSEWLKNLPVIHVREIKNWVACVPPESFDDDYEGNAIDALNYDAKPGKPYVKLQFLFWVMLRENYLPGDIGRGILKQFAKTCAEKFYDPKLAALEKELSFDIEVLKNKEKAQGHYELIGVSNLDEPKAAAWGVIKILGDLDQEYLKWARVYMLSLLSDDLAQGPK